jgi:putative nucleotidyltransferase with HDIG domain
VAGVIGAGIATTLIGLSRSSQVDWVVISLLTVLTIIAELIQLDLYGDDVISVSVVFAFASALIAGIPGIACVSVGMTLSHALRGRLSLHQLVFRWATHVLAGLSPAFITHILDISLLTLTLPTFVLSAVASFLYYIVNTSVLAIATRLSESANALRKRHVQPQLLIGHYLVLGLMGAFLGIAYSALGQKGILGLALPILLMRFLQKQDTQHIKDHTRELDRTNWELNQAKREAVTASQSARQLNEELLLTLARTIDARIPSTTDHSERVAECATQVACQMRLPPERVELVRQAAFLHDIGKVSIPENVLQKPDKLTDEEYNYVKTHAVLGSDILDQTKHLKRLIWFIKHHHEWWDGNGYPDGLKGEQIPLEARILAVCDAVETMAADRPYKEAMPPEEIITEVRACSGTQFAPDVVDALISVIKRKGRLGIISATEASLHKRGINGDLSSHTEHRQVLSEHQPNP